MKCLVSILLCFLAANAFASPADSGKCPWKLPFTITIHSVGGLHHYISNSTDLKLYPNTDYGTTAGTDDFAMTVDTSISDWESRGDSNIVFHYSINGRILVFSVSGYHAGVVPYSYTDSIAFALHKDSIIFLSCEANDSYPSSAFMPGVSKSFYFRMSTVLFTDTSMFTMDSSFSAHNIQTRNDETDNYFTFSGGISYIDHKDFTASSVILTGLFRTTTFSDPPSIVAGASPSNNIGIYNSNGSLACSFDRSERERTLDVFSPLGIKLAAVNIPPATDRVSLPHLQPGFYFLRLEGNVRKVLLGG